MTAFNEAAHGLSVADAMETRFNAIPVEANLGREEANLDGKTL